METEQKKMDKKKQMKLQFLQYLIHSSKRYSQQSQLVVKELPQQSKLYLYLRNSQLQGIVESKQIGKAIKCLDYLIQLKIQISSNNNLSCEGLIQLAKSFKHLIHLESLSLSISSNNNIGNIGVTFLGESLKNLKNTTQLSISIFSNPIQSEGAIALVAGFKDILGLNKLKFQLVDYLIDQECVVEIIKSLSNLKFENIKFKILLVETNKEINNFQDSILKIQEETPQLLSSLQIVQHNQRVLLQNFENVIKKISTLKSRKKLTIQDMIEINKLARKGVKQDVLDLIQSQQQLILKVEGSSKDSEMNEFGNVFFDQFKSLSQLTVDINNQMIDSIQAGNIADIIRNIKTAIHLQINISDDNKTDVISINLIIQGIKACSNIQSLSINTTSQILLQFISLMNTFKSINESVLFPNFKCIKITRNSQSHEIEGLNLSIDYVNKTQYQTCQYFMESLKELNTLKRLNISLNDLDQAEQKLVLLSGGFKYLVMLEELTIDMNLKRIDSLVDGIGQCKYLRKVSLLILNQDFQYSFKKLATSLSQLKQLKDLSLQLGYHNSYFTELNSKQINELAKINTLEYLSLKCQLECFTTKGTDMVQQWFNQLSNLKGLTLEVTSYTFYFDDDKTIKLIQAVNSLAHLEKLSLNIENSMRYFFKLLQKKNSFPNLKELNLTVKICNEEKMDYKYIIESIELMSGLEKLGMNLEVVKALSCDQIEQFKTGIQNIQLKQLKSIECNIRAPLSYSDHYYLSFMNLNYLHSLKVKLSPGPYNYQHHRNYKRKNKKLVICL